MRSFAAAFASAHARLLPAQRRRTLRVGSHACRTCTVVGSINLDLVARAERLPRPGETVTGATFAQIPGGKGANQAVAAARLGAHGDVIGCVGDDDFAAPRSPSSRRGRRPRRAQARRTTPTGVALITVDAAGENVIVVAPGANTELRPADVDLPDCDGVLCQLEIPLETVEQRRADRAGRLLPQRRAGARAQSRRPT